MGLILLKDRAGGYRRTWYAIMSINGKRTSRALKTPLRGVIPTDGDGRFSLALAGDAAFEQSKADALAELDTENRSRKESKANARKNAEALGVRTVRITDLADENAKRKKYALIEGTREYKYNKSVYDILAHFSNWTASRPKKKNAKRYYLLSDIDGELVREYYAEISTDHKNRKGEVVKGLSWQSFRKYVFILKAVFKHFTGGAVANPFETEYADYKGKKSEFGDKAEVAHKPPSAEQMARAWEYARSRTDKPYLHRLAVVAACTGLRVGDCCNLTWDKVDLLGGVIHGVKTKKTGAVVSVPIFDYDTRSKDYNPVFGELRRELEAALAEREDGEKYVIPEAARIYGYNPSRIIEEGKDVFAHAIAEADAPEVAMIAGEEPKPKTPAEILAAIDAAPFATAKKERVRLVYELYTMGKTYRQIAEATGKTKAAASEDLATVERLTGEHLRKGVAPQSERNRRLELIEATRQSRGQGQRAACLYGWHSCRMFFVGYAFYEIGMSEAELIGITGHATVKMVRHYIETSGNSAVAAAKRRNAERNYSRRLLEDRNAAGRAKTPTGARGTESAVIPMAQGADAPQATESATTEATAHKTAAERLKEARNLLDEGLLTPEEYEAKRKEIIAEI